MTLSQQDISEEPAAVDRLRWASWGSSQCLPNVIYVPGIGLGPENKSEELTVPSSSGLLFSSWILTTSREIITQSHGAVVVATTACDRRAIHHGDCAERGSPSLGLH